jgi:hypothetical protein
MGYRLVAKLAVMCGVAVAAASGGAVAAMPAAADAGINGINCASGYHCVFYTDFNSSKHSYFNSDSDFSGDILSGGNGVGSGQGVNNNIWAASNSSTGGYESHYYDSPGYVGFLFCVNPGDSVQLPANLRDRASSLRLRTTTPIECIGS